MAELTCTMLTHKADLRWIGVSNPRSSDPKAWTLSADLFALFLSISDYRILENSECDVKVRYQMTSEEGGDKRLDPSVWLKGGEKEGLDPLFGFEEGKKRVGPFCKITASEGKGSSILSAEGGALNNLLKGLKQAGKPKTTE
ncbi:hypothetical protein AVEN_165373-1 [Araneus ventricosus]|uniref:Uncharacterized protein n=1 Tax=Araneus ventricosus TaxID=182803 RepID=A0A4Y2AUH0_ARAVE|nr:hypothetical protein AVEN_165373-1 [Araneus ventricosus]